MILKSLKLENIRSYADQTVSFPLGTTLFEGDIGSGKSTILMAVEFALFGLGSEKGGALLKAGEKQGSVILRFEVEGKDYEVYRRLERRAKSVQQSEGTLKIDDQIMNLSASELKEKVLEVLAFNEPPDPKAQSVIYRYAIFTPQEEMNQAVMMLYVRVPINRVKFKEKFGVYPEEAYPKAFEELRRKNLITEQNGVIRLSEKGDPWRFNIAWEFFK